MAMSDLNHNLFEEMLNDYLPEEKKSGDIINGIITRKDMDFAYLDLSGKQEGRILIREVEDYNVGDSIEVKVLRNDEEYIIVSKFLLDKAKEFSSYEVDEIVTGTVLKKIKGGYSVRVGKNEAFLPFSLASLDRDKDYTGEKFRFLFFASISSHVGNVTVLLLKTCFINDLSYSRLKSSLTKYWLSAIFFDNSFVLLGSGYFLLSFSSNSSSLTITFFAISIASSSVSPYAPSSNLKSGILTS